MGRVSIENQTVGWQSPKTYMNLTGGRNLFAGEA